MVADKADDSRALIDTIHTRSAEAVILPRANNRHPREFDSQVYRARNLVERLFGRTKCFQRVATRYDKLDGRYQAFVASAPSLICLA